jgi:hypothetical protein
MAESLVVSVGVRFVLAKLSSRGFVLIIVHGASADRLPLSISGRFLPAAPIGNQIKYGPGIAKPKRSRSHPHYRIQMSGFSFLLLPLLLQTAGTTQ